MHTCAHVSFAASHLQHTRTHTHDDVTTTHICMDTYTRHRFADSVENTRRTLTRVPCDTKVTQFTLRATYDTCDVIIQVMCHVDHMSSIRDVHPKSHIARHVLHKSRSACPRHISCQRTCTHVTRMCITRHIICHVTSSCIHWGVTGHCASGANSCVLHDCCLGVITMCA